MREIGREIRNMVKGSRYLLMVPYTLVHLRRITLKAKVNLNGQLAICMKVNGKNLRWTDKENSKTGTTEESMLEFSKETTSSRINA
jgi:hypothetical protein